MAAIASVLARLRQEPLAELPIADRIAQLCRECAHGWRDRLLTPLVTLRLFLLQVLHGNAAIAHLRQLSGLNFAPASYCEARQRLPLSVIRLAGGGSPMGQRASPPGCAAAGFASAYRGRLEFHHG